MLSKMIAVMKTNRAKKNSAKHFKAVAGKRLTEEQIKLFIEFYNVHKTVPGNKIPCNVTGKLTTCVGPWKDKKIKEYGGLENLLRNYKRREATPKVKKEQQQKETSYSLPIMKLRVPKPLTPEQLAKESKSVCLRPDIYLDNGRHCEGCFYYNFCLSGLKKLPKHATAA